MKKIDYNRRLRVKESSFGLRSSEKSSGAINLMEGMLNVTSETRCTCRKRRKDCQVLVWKKALGY